MLVNEFTVTLSKKILNGSQFSCYEDLVAIPCDNNNLGVWCLNDLKKKPVILTGHHNTVLCTRFCPKNQGFRDDFDEKTGNILISVSSDYIIKWKIDDIKYAFKSKDFSVKGSVISQSPGEVHHLSVNMDSNLVSCCLNNDIYVYSAQSKESLVKFEGHSSRVNQAEFVPTFTKTIISISNDRTFKVWGVESLCQLYSSSILCASPLTHICLHSLGGTNYFSIASQDAIIRTYIITEAGEYNFLNKIDLNKATVCSMTNSQNNEPIKSVLKMSHFEKMREAEIMEKVDNEVLSILFIGYFNNQSTLCPVNKDSSCDPEYETKTELINELRNKKIFLMVSLASRVLIFNSQTLDLISACSFQDVIDVDGKSVVISALANCVICKCLYFQNKFWMIANKLCGKEIYFLSFSIQEKNYKNYSFTGYEKDDFEDDSLSVLSKRPLVVDSILKSQLIPKVADPVKKATKSNTYTRPTIQYGGLDKKGKISDKLPLSFHENIKSSGYNVKKKGKCIYQRSKSESRVVVSTKIDKTKNDVDETTNLIPTCLKSTLLVSETHAAINNICTFRNGQYSVCSDYSGVVTFLKKTKNSRWIVDKAFSAYKTPVAQLNISHNSTYAISCDKNLAQIHTTNQDTSILTLNYQQGNLKEKQDTTKPFSQSLTHCQFYYVDKFIIITSGNELFLYTYYIDFNKADFKRQLNNSKYKLVKSFQMSECQNITAFSAINSFYSYIGLSCCSDKSITVLDFNVGSQITKIKQVHDRNVHTIQQFSGSEQELESSHYDLFVTSATSDCIKIWDLRTRQCVRRFCSHINQIHPCRVTFSPCGNYIATGSEDKSVFIYDIRHDNISKLTGLPDSVLGLTFNSKSFELLAATLDGHVCF